MMLKQKKKDQKFTILCKVVALFKPALKQLGGKATTYVAQFWTGSLEPETGVDVKVCQCATG